jgi:hypothetical protein
VFFYLKSRETVIIVAKRLASLLPQPVKWPKLKISYVIQGLQKVLGLDTQP